LEDQWNIHSIAGQRTWRQMAERIDIIVANYWEREREREIFRVLVGGFVA